MEKNEIQINKHGKKHLEKKYNGIRETFFMDFIGPYLLLSTITSRPTSPVFKTK